ncbi:hypothetical protein [Anabaena lutea]|uniref:Uncharacterized protein n=1 Tax=Anabaena lutea FACHB-196 TaxID=2692881 RepID=A0ABR8FF61_9NOST|nr:hypothetical protein [Anabaena lutea]MBD2568352.1 hypothetical protein [Anabaena lutea FACHB-196]
MQTRKDDGIFPLVDSGGNYIDAEFGLTKREYFAAMAMQGLIIQNEYFPHSIPTKAVELANELIKALNENDSNVTE